MQRAIKNREGKGLSLSERDMRWWRNAKFGMFIHWGVYAIPGKGEWLMWNERIPFREYRKLADRFAPRKFSADAWAAAARAAGMKYMVLTARHHDGFCLFDSRASEFTSVKTAARRDFVAEFTRACRRAGLGVGLYYSPLDWRYPGFFFPDLYRESAEALKEQTYAQIRELMTGYGKIDILWYDGGGDDWLGFGGMEWGGDQPGWHSRDSSWPQKKNYAGRPLWESDKLNAMVRSLQPSIAINDRSCSYNGKEWTGDFHTPECRIGTFNAQRAWESCFTLAGSWGWQPHQPMRSLRDIVQMLTRTATGDGNLLLNVAPTADGEIEARQVRRLAEVGTWLAACGEAVYGTRGGPFPNGPWGGFTHKNRQLYVHVLDWPEDCVTVPALNRRVVSVRSLTASGVRVKKRGQRLQLSVPAADRQAASTVFVLELDRPL